MSSFKNQILTMSGPVDSALITDDTLRMWTNQSFSEIWTLIPPKFLESLQKNYTSSIGKVLSQDLGGASETSKVKHVFCQLFNTYNDNPQAFKKWKKLLGNSPFSEGQVPNVVKAREIKLDKFISDNSHISNVELKNFGDIREYDFATPLDPVWAYSGEGILCAPMDFTFDVWYIDIPEFTDINGDMSSHLNSFYRIPNEILNIMSIYVARMVKYYELDSLQFPAFSTDIVIEDWIDSDNYSFIENLSNILGNLNSVENLTSPEFYLRDEDTELVASTLKKSAQELDVFKNQVGTINEDLGKKISKLQLDITLYSSKINAFKSEASKLNEDIKTLTLKYNEAISSINGQPFTGKATSNELDKVKQELANLKSQIGGRG